MATLKELGIAFDPKADLPTLKALVPEGTDLGAATADPADIDGIDVGDPEELQPVALPLVVKPSKGREWENEEQAEYAGYLNAYAYKNKKKWAKKKPVLLARLVEIGKNPELLGLYKGGEDAGIKYVDHRLGAPVEEEEAE